MSTVHDVAIVGFGPSGAVAASLLGQAGLKTYVCDKSSTVYEKPRAIALDPSPHLNILVSMAS